MSLFQFDATQVSPQTPRAAWPKSKYKVAIMQSEMKDVGAKNSGNKGIAFGAKALEVLGAPAGFEVPASLLLFNINILNSNPDAQRIGQSELSSICHATGVLKIQDTQNLHGHPFVIDVDTEFVQGKNENGTPSVDNLGNPTGTTYNRIKGYYKADGSPITASGVKQPQVQNAQPAWGGAMQPQTQPPVQAPVQPAPAPPPVAAPPPPVPTTPVLFYVSHKGAMVTPAPVTREGVLALNLPASEIMVNEMGKEGWIKGEEFLGVAAAPPAPASNSETPPWMRAQQ